MFKLNHASLQSMLRSSIRKSQNLKLGLFPIVQKKVITKKYLLFTSAGVSLIGAKLVKYNYNLQKPIIICSSCKGIKKMCITDHVDHDDHNEYIYERCKHCMGKGFIFSYS